MFCEPYNVRYLMCLYYMFIWMLRNSGPRDVLNDELDVLDAEEFSCFLATEYVDCAGAGLYVDEMGRFLYFCAINIGACDC